MAFVAVATGVGATVLGTGAAAGIGSTLVGGALIGAGIGGLYSGITGDGNILNSMLTGGLIGGAAGGIGGALFPGAAGYGSAATSVGLNPALTAAAPSTAAVPTSNVVTGTAAQSAGYGLKGAGSASQMAANQAAVGLGSGAAAPTASTFSSFVPTMPKTTATQLATNLGGKAATSALTGKQALGYGLAGTTAMQLLGGGKGAQAPASATYPGDIRPYEFAARPTSGIGESAYPTTQYDMAGNPILDTAERSYFDQGYTPLQAYRAGTANPNPVMVAQGGLMAAYPMEKYGNSIPNTEVYGMGMAQGGGIMAAGGKTSSLGSYSDGGRMLKGPGDGMSDNIPGVIGGKQPARLADGEFVVPADVVSHLGNGSTDAGAKRLYAMMDTVRKARTGNKKQGKQIKAEKYLPA
jgi:hypothetical protein